MSTVVQIEARVLLMGLPIFTINPSCEPTSFNIEMVVVDKTLSGEDFFGTEVSRWSLLRTKVGISTQLPQELVPATQFVLVYEIEETEAGASGCWPQQLADATSFLT